MPWSKEQNHSDCDGWAVVKDSDGTLVGCHATKQEANDQIAALNIAEQESERMNESALQRLWSGIKRAFGDAGLDVDKTERAMSGSRLYDKVYVAGSKMSPDYFYMHDIFFDNERTYVIYSTGGMLYQAEVNITGEDATLAEPVQVAEEFVPVATRSLVARQSDGQYRWFSVSATSVLNRDGEIDSRDLFDSFVENFDPDSPPERQFFHLGPQSRMGLIDYVGRDGNALITSGLYDDNVLARADIEAKQHNPDLWGESISYKPLSAPEITEIGGAKIPVYRTGKLIETSTLPEGDAANYFTNSQVLEVSRMNQKQKDALLKLAGDDKELLEQLNGFFDSVDKTNRSIDSSGIVTRESSDDDRPEPGEPENNVEVDDELIAVIVREVVDKLENEDNEKEPDEQLLALARQVSEIQATIQDIVGRVAQYEKSDEQKRKEWTEDLPRQKPRRAIYRPSDGQVDGDGDAKAAPTFAERAAQVDGARY